MTPRHLLLLATAAACPIFTGCGDFVAAKVFPAKYAFGVSANTIVLNHKSTAWPITLPTATAMLGEPVRVKTVLGDTVFVWHAHGVAASQQKGGKFLNVSFWFHKSLHSGTPAGTVNAVVVNGVTLSRAASIQDLEKAGFVRVNSDTSNKKSSPLQEKLAWRERTRVGFNLSLGRMAVSAVYHTQQLQAIDNHGFPQWPGLSLIWVGER